ncbi:hypothetical protein AXF19_03515 [Selenomonas sp. oral taxon 126]|uniref:hypothetical protein n=1 Tax=Selenomonas sp. oral taxon 126 TaxID=712528 RepID=UPI00080786C4|nr:hypothetical protein [Selenomonas sp. oral taxon 126]ANR70149.1 hypothetical protein AXF19_03515 [Selenomonas sp. oral taxon 126]
MALKWNMNNVVAARGNTYTCIARFDNSRFWLEVNAITSVQNFKGHIRRIAQLCGAKEVEIKYLHMDDEEGTLTEPRENIVLFSNRGDDYRYFTESIDPATGRRVINYLAPEEVFHLGSAQNVSEA